MSGKTKVRFATATAMLSCIVGATSAIAGIIAPRLSQPTDPHAEHLFVENPASNPLTGNRLGLAYVSFEDKLEIRDESGTVFSTVDFSSLYTGVVWQSSSPSLGVGLGADFAKQNVAVDSNDTQASEAREYYGKMHFKLSQALYFGLRFSQLSAEAVPTDTSMSTSGTDPQSAQLTGWAVGLAYVRPTIAWGLLYQPAMRGKMADGGESLIIERPGKYGFKLALRSSASLKFGLEGSRAIFSENPEVSLAGLDNEMGGVVCELVALGAESKFIATSRLRASIGRETFCAVAGSAAPQTDDESTTQFRGKLFLVLGRQKTELLAGISMTRREQIVSPSDPSADTGSPTYEFGEKQLFLSANFGF